MTMLQAIVLGIVQGLGEFLPISSSGHLLVFPWLMGWPEQPLEFDIALHVGTLVAVIAAFAGDWIRILGAGLGITRSEHPSADEDRTVLWKLAVACIPGAVCGLLLEHRIETQLRSPLLVMFTMAILGVVLLLADRHAAEEIDHPVTWRDAILIGLAQAFAVIPGVSRSGSTISMALFLGYKREHAARFSFLLATPITMGAALLKVPHLLHGGHLAPVYAGMVAAAVVGLLSIKVLLTYVRRHSYSVFAYYRFAFAALILLVWLARRG
jgi:undecaprenyl-diphosphatase